MTAIPLSKHFKNIDVSPADEYVKRVFEDATYMDNGLEQTLVLKPSYNDVDKIEDGMLYAYYLINGKLYESSYTTSHEELIRFYGKKRKVIEQMTLF